MAYRANLINALINLYHKDLSVSPKSESTGNRINDAGVAFEKFIEELFYNPKAKNNEKEIQEYFSHKGSSNSPPDLILKLGDAIEIKKLTSIRALPLNSSWPRKILSRDDPKISSRIRECEDANGGWQEKDYFYATGIVPNDKNPPETIFFVQGPCIAASHFQDFYNTIKAAINTAAMTLKTGPEIGKTNELGRLNKIDKLGFTDLRIRGMFQIKHPLHIFEYLCLPDNKKDLNVFCLMTEAKYKSFDPEDTNALEKLADVKVKRNVAIQDPEDGISDLKCVFVSFGVTI
jgi:hypothetical protein